MAWGRLRSILHKDVAIDADGYLVNFDDWNESVARDLATRAGEQELTRENIEALRFIRNYYRKYHFFPIVRAVCKHVHRPKDCLQQDFPNPLAAWKAAGLPHPEEPILSLLEAGQSPG